MAKKGKILFDSGHNTDPLEVLVEELKKDGFVCYTHRGLISSETLEPYTALFLAYPRKDFEEEEINAIVEFSRQGGCVTITANPQTQKEYEIFIENKGELIKLLLNTGIMYKQLYPRIPLYLIKDNLQYVPLKEGLTPSDIGIPYSQLNFFPIDLWKKQLLEDVKEIFEERKTGFSYFYPVDKEKVLVKKWIDIGFPSISDMGFNYERLDSKTREVIDDATKKERDELFNACVGLLNPMQEGIGRNLGFCGNFFADELIEQDKGKKANFRLIADLLKHCSKARLFVISSEELKPRGEEVPITPIKPVIKIPDILSEIKERALELQRMVGDRFVTYKPVKQAREDLIDKLIEARLHKQPYFNIFIEMREEIDSKIPEHRTLEEREYNTYRALYQSALSDLLNDIERKEKEVNKIQENIVRFEQ